MIRLSDAQTVILLGRLVGRLKVCWLLSDSHMQVVGTTFNACCPSWFYPACFILEGRLYP